MPAIDRHQPGCYPCREAMAQLSSALVSTPAPENGSMSAADFKASLYAQLKTAGVMNSLKVTADMVSAIHVRQQ